MTKNNIVEKDVFDKEEWMLENDLVQGEAVWEKFHSKAKFEFCDIRLKDGTELGPCWYSGKKFILVSDDDSAFFENKFVAEVRYYEQLEPEDAGKAEFFSDEDDEDNDSTGDILDEDEEDEDGDV